MRTDGAYYENAFVIDSLCCPSRAALFTGQTPHQTGVLTNTANDPTNPIGGWVAFEQYGNLERSFNVPLHDSGYTTGFIGKYINGYEARTVDGQLQPPPKVPGWTDFEAILGGGYNGWGYRHTFLDDNGELQMVQEPKPPLTAPIEERDSHYATNVAADKAIGFVDRHAEDAAPYFLEVATYAPHASLQRAYPGDPAFPPAFADRASADDPTSGNCGVKSCGDLSLNDLVGYGDPRDDNAPTYLHTGRTSAASAWRTNQISLTDDQALTRYRDRARMVQAVDRLIGRVREAVGPDTYVVLTADNGFHLGQHQLNGGKGTPYDSDTRVPLVVVGPDVVPGPRSQYISNIDLAPTIEQLAGLTSPSYRSGRSFADTLSDPEAPGDHYALFEHTYALSQPDDSEPDADDGSGGTIDIIPSYIGIRGDRGLLVRFDLDLSWEGEDYAWELYRYDVPWEDRNVFAEDHDLPWVQDLKRRIEVYEDCTPTVCRQAAR
jgi:arylsulfatase A-like enzyme